MSAGCLLSIPKLVPLFRDSLEAATPKAATVDVFAQQAAVIVFSDNVVAVIDVFDHVATNDILFDAPAGLCNEMLVKITVTVRLCA